MDQESDQHPPRSSRVWFKSYKMEKIDPKVVLISDLEGSMLAPLGNME